MALADLTKEAVLKAIGEFDELGREASWRNMGSGSRRDTSSSTTASGTTARRLLALPMGTWVKDFKR